MCKVSIKTALVMPVAGMLCGLLMADAYGEELRVRIKIENLAPEQGNFLTPVWVGFHNGDFDILDPAVAASAGLERLAEDGDPSVLAQEFFDSGAGVVEGTCLGPGTPPVLDPGDVLTHDLVIDTDADSSRYFSYASMVIPSNDAFIANPFSKRHPVFRNGRFALRDFLFEETRS